MIRLMNNEQRQTMSKRAYELHRDGMDISSVAEKLHLEVFQAESMIDWWGRHRVATPEQELAARIHLSRLEIELQRLTAWEEHLEENKMHGRPHLLAMAAATLAKTKLDISKEWANKMGLDVPITLNVTTSTPIDDEVMKLVAEHSAASEIDLPLD